MKILITGGQGFIGSHLVKALQDYNEIVVIDNLSAEGNTAERFWSPLAKNGNVTYHKLDICDDSIEHLFHGVGCVFHMAAEARIQASIDDPKYTTKVNVLGTVNVLNACVKHDVKRIIYSGSSSVYGLTESFPTNETATIDCLNPYAATKYAGEEMIRCFTKLHGLDSCIFRYFNVYGENSPVHGPYSLVIGLFLDQKRRGENLTVVGTGSSLRDFVHVSDVVDANIKAMNSPLNIKGEAFNIGFGANYAILDVAKMISDNIVFVEPRPGEAKTTLADITKATTVFGWTPRVKLPDWLANAGQCG